MKRPRLESVLTFIACAFGALCWYSIFVYLCN